jgi:acetyltransferase-like isoleucine patch superfamily enzyme
VRHVIHDESKAFNLRLSIVHGLTAVIPWYVGMRLRARLLRFAGIRIGRGTTIWGKVLVAGSDNPARNLTIGKQCHINGGCQFDVSAPIVIGDNVTLGHEVLMLTGGHEIGPPGRRAAGLTRNPIVVGRGAWLGARVMVLPGVTIGDGAVVAAGAVVTRDVAPNTTVAGIPARHLNDLAGPETMNVNPT